MNSGKPLKYFNKENESPSYVLERLSWLWTVTGTDALHRRRDRPDLWWGLIGEILGSLVGVNARAPELGTRELSLESLRKLPGA